MAVTTFAAIDISSYEITMKIFEFSKKGGFRTVDDIRYRLNLGVGTRLDCIGLLSELTFWFLRHRICMGAG